MKTDLAAAGNPIGQGSIADIMDGVLKGTIIHELLLGEVIPYYDLDMKIENMDELEKTRDRIHDEAVDELIKIWGADAHIFVYDSSGIKTSERYTGPYISGRYLVRNVGKVKCGMELKRAGLVPAMFDQGAYGEVGKNKYMRIAWGPSKHGEDRPMKWSHDGKYKILRESLECEADIAKAFFGFALIQNVMREKLIENTEPKCEISMDGFDDQGQAIAIGRNGQPLGEDVEIKTEGDIRALCTIAGWFNEKDRAFITWRDELWMLRNISDDYKIDLDALALDVSGVNKEKHNDAEALAMMAISRSRPPNMPRKNLAHLRIQAREKDKSAYFAWYGGVKKTVHILPSTDESRMIFHDHNEFTGKKIDIGLALKWARDCLVYVENMGTPYFMTRNFRTCRYTNKKIEAWGRSKQADLKQCLNTRVYMDNPNSEKGFVNLGWGSKVELGFMEYAAPLRLFPVASHEDFIPYLACNIPDERIAISVKDKALMNLFTGFPIESVRLNEETPKYLGSAIHSHLLKVICHGDQKEYEHLEGTIADMIQQPYRISNVAHIFYGGQGSGKSALLQFMRQLIGCAHVMEFNDINTYMRNFNDDHTCAILKIFEEVGDKGEQFVNNGKLKAEITKTMIRIEIKNAAIIHMRNCARLWFISNHRNNLHIDHDDRRFTHHEVINDNADDHSYFDPIWASLKDEQFIRACFEYFAELKYSDEFVTHAFVTKYKQEQKIDSLSLPLKFLNDFMYADMIGYPIIKDEINVSSRSVYDAYVEWARRNNQIKVGRNGTLTKIFEEVGIPKPSRKYISGTQVTCYVMDKPAILAGFRKYLKNPEFEFLIEGSI